MKNLDIMVGLIRFNSD